MERAMPLPTVSSPPPSESQDSSENSIPVPEPPELPTSLPPTPLSSETKEANSAKRAVGRGKSTRGGALAAGRVYPLRNMGLAVSTCE